MLLISALIILFILKLRFPKGKSISEILVKRYGRQGLLLFRNCEKFDFKLRKIKCDIEFLTTCIEHNLRPTFVNFKLYNDKLERSPLYSSFQRKLLENELKEKRSQERVIRRKLNTSLASLERVTIWIDFAKLTHMIYRNSNKKICQVKRIHSRKLFGLGLRNQNSTIDPDNLIFNYSDRHLTDEEQDALVNGLQFGLPPSKINYHRYFLEFEKFFSKFKGK